MVVRMAQHAKRRASARQGLPRLGSKNSEGLGWAGRGTRASGNETVQKRGRVDWWRGYMWAAGGAITGRRQVLMGGGGGKPTKGPALQDDASPGGSSARHSAPALWRRQAARRRAHRALVGRGGALGGRGGGALGRRGRTLGGRRGRGAPGRRRGLEAGRRLASVWGWGALERRGLALCWGRR